jgi:hypothetical protein
LHKPAALARKTLRPWRERRKARERRRSIGHRFAGRKAKAEGRRKCEPRLVSLLALAGVRPGQKEQKQQRELRVAE